MVTDIYLASASPRRRELLDQLGVKYKLLAVNVDEVRQAGETPEDFVQRMAVEKAMAGLQAAPDDTRPVMGADTVVVLDAVLMGKPQDRADGIAMLQQLSGRSHRVMSAVALVGPRTGGVAIIRLNTSNVTFRDLSQAECEAYWETGEPVDKAGAYAIQGQAAAFITRLEGSYSGVMGLPLYETAELLQTYTDA